MLPKELKIGSTIAHWSVETIFGEHVPKIEDFKDKPLLIVFFNLGCPGCLGRAIPYANRIVYENGQDINVVGIHSNIHQTAYNLDQFKKAKEEFYIRFPFFKDQNFDATFRAYGAGGTPHWILLDGKGVLKYSLFGSDPNNALLKLDYKINEVLEAK